MATVVLFYVSYWLLSKMEVVKWNQFVKSKVHDALTSGSALALAAAAFLAVYREGFETVLFYKALFVSGGSAVGAMPVVAGMLAGGVILVGVYVAIHRFGVRLPLKPFFGVTSAFLYYMAFVFAGKGIAELQEGALVTTTILPARRVCPRSASIRRWSRWPRRRSWWCSRWWRSPGPSCWSPGARQAAARGPSHAGRAGRTPSAALDEPLSPSVRMELTRRSSDGGRPGRAPRRSRAHAPARP